MYGYKICKTEKDFAEALKLTGKYFEWLKIDLSVYDVSQELEEFSRMYFNPDGAFITALNEKEEVIGGVGIREYSNDICEMKRLFVLPEYFGKGIGESLCKKVIVVAKELGYSKIRLDTLERLISANRLFKKLGFYPVDPFREITENDMIFLELDISN